MRTKRLVTLSGLEHVAICPPSVSLRRVEHNGDAANLGNATHECIARRIDDGRVPSYEELAGIADRWGLEDADRGRMHFVARHFDPPVPRWTKTEFALGMFNNGAVCPVEGARGEYEAAPGLEVAGTLDAMWSEPRGLLHVFAGEDVCLDDGDTLVVVDWKTGEDLQVPPIARNWQLRAGALLAARYTRATRVIPAICYVNAGECGEVIATGEPYQGRWEMGLPLGPSELDAIERDLRALLGRAADADAKFVTGKHCDYCKSRIYCRTQLAEVRALASPLAEDLWAEDTALSDVEARRLAGSLSRFEWAAAKARTALERHVQARGPITLDGGKVWGPQVETREILDPSIAHAALSDEFAPIVGDVDGSAEALQAFKVTKKAIYDAIRAAHDREGIKGQKGKALDRVLEVVRAAGGVTMRDHVEHRAYYPSAPEVDKSAAFAFAQAVEATAEAAAVADASKGSAITFAETIAVAEQQMCLAVLSGAPVVHKVTEDRYPWEAHTRGPMLEAKK